ncbi:MAG TPA: holo-ACP synthase [Acidimicrobiales bacterium]|nr:holo-ACP synthase [Acidimicrobiales bacterium]|tara:strand:- start:75 stop:440 length:366 start_codon:yes stop_codon:yes gene_type:complete
MIGIGVDLVDVDRFRHSLTRTPGLRDRLFLPEEQEYSERQSDPTERYAARFAAKEAVLKALGLGLGSVSFQDIEIVHTVSGEPALRLHSKAIDIASEAGVEKWLLTLTHTHRTAAAVAVAL